MEKFKEIKEKFKKLPEREKENLLKDFYNFSKDTKLFLEGRFTNIDVGREFIRQMEKETIDKVHKMPPKEPNGRKINLIISKAKKSNVNIATILELEKLAFRGFIEFLNEYGGGPESFDELGANHFETYIKLVRTEIKDLSEKNAIYQELKDYLLDKDNMYTDELDQIYEDITGIPVER